MVRTMIITENAVNRVAHIPMLLPTVPRGERRKGLYNHFIRKRDEKEKEEEERDCIIS